MVTSTILTYSLKRKDSIEKIKKQKETVPQRKNRKHLHGK